MQYCWKASRTVMPRLVVRWSVPALARSQALAGAMGSEVRRMMRWRVEVVGVWWWVWKPKERAVIMLSIWEPM